MLRINCFVGLGALLAATSLAPATSQPCAVDSMGKCKPINIVCNSLADHQIDWDCIFGPESLEEVFENGGDFTTCPEGSKAKPCSRFIVDKDEERAEVKVQEGPKGFPFLKGEKYIFKYSFKAKEGMKVARRFTHIGQLKGSANGYMVKGDPIYSLTANHYGLQVRFSNKESIEDFHPGMEEELEWEDATGEWVHVEIITTFGESMVVNISGAVKGQAVWPSNLKPIAWHRDSEMVRMKLGLYHSQHNVADGEVIYRDISIEGPNGIIRTSPPADDDDNKNNSGNEGTCSIDTATGKCRSMDITCGSRSGHTIDWECIFGHGSLVEVEARGGKMVSCPSASNLEPCSRFIVPKESERAEVLVQQGVGGFQFKKGESYVFRYSFRARDKMKVSGSSTRLGQMKGVSRGFQLKGNPLLSITANNNGINARFNNEDYDRVEGMDEYLSWEDSTGEWVNVEIKTTFGKSMEVNFSGAVNGKAVWPSKYKPVAWNDDADSIMFKLGIYHTKNKVADAEVEYKNISIEGPSGKIRTSALGIPDHGSPEGVMYVGCVRDKPDRVLKNLYKNDNMTPEMCAEYCEGEDFFGLQYSNECWCGSVSDDEDVFRYGTATCEYPCAGDDEQTCGGYWSMSLYEYGSPLDIDVPEGSRYLGCYQDHRFERALSLKLASNSDMTHEWCMDFCSEFKAKYYGLQWGRECFCGGADEDYNQYGTSTCDMPCAGQPNIICGGSLALSVFMVY